MSNSALNKINNGIKQHGLLYFIKLNLTEQIFKQKFKKLSVYYTVNNIAKEVINKDALNKDSKINQASPYYEIKKAFLFTGIKYQDINLLDIGCGSGKVLNFGMMLNFNEVIGIDLDELAIKDATINCQQMQKNGYSTPFSIFKSDATTFTIPPGINVIYLFNPFGKITMKYVVDNIIEYYEREKKEMYIIYSIPIHQDLFIAHKEFIKVYERLNGSKTKYEMAIFKIGKTDFYQLLSS